MQVLHIGTLVTSAAKILQEGMGDFITITRFGE
jgi:hypothetical protein